MRAMILGCLSALLLFCSPDINKVEASGGLARLPAVNNVEIVLDFRSINGKIVQVNNANARSVGVDIRKLDNKSMVIFSDSWIGAGRSEVGSGVNFEYGWELLVTVVVYKNLGGAAQGFIQTLGSGFLEDIQDFHIESEEERVVVVSQ